MRNSKRARNRAADADIATEQNSLFGEILDWMLAPLVFLWPLSIAVTHQVAIGIANDPYDQALAENLKVVARLAQHGSGQREIRLPAPARAFLHADERDTVYFQVFAADGRLVAGDREIPVRSRAQDVEPDRVHFRDDEVDGEEVRVAYRYQRVGPAGEEPVLIQVAETRGKRAELAGRIVSGMMLPIFATVPIAVVLVYVGLGRGIAPLNRLRRYIQRRRPTDLSPIAPTGIPEEVRPLILAFNDMMARLEENLQAQQRFIADAAHQMRTPLTGLKMQTELALSETDPQHQRAALERIAESAERAAHLINQLLALARAESSSEKAYAVEALDLERLAQAVTQEFVPRALAKGIDLGLEITGWPLMIDGNPVLLREMAKNLIDNAIKYTPAGGKVTVRTLASDKAILAVEDNGIGIPEAERPLVFERFYRVLGSGADGSGLGLPIVREIAELHRGSVELHGTPGGGSTFQVSFPRHHARSREIPVSDEAPAAVPLRRSSGA